MHSRSANSNDTHSVTGIPTAATGSDTSATASGTVTVLYMHESQVMNAQAAETRCDGYRTDTGIHAADSINHSFMETLQGLVNPVQ